MTKYIFVFYSLLFCSCKLSSSQNNSSFIGRRAYNYPVWSNIKSDTTACLKRLKGLVFDKNNNEKKAFYCQWEKEKLYTYRHHQKGEYPLEKIYDIQNDWGYVGTVNGFPCFSRNRFFTSIFLETGEKKIKSDKIRVYSIRDFSNDSVVFAGWDTYTNKVGLFKEQTNLLLEGQSTQPVSVYDIGIDNYPKEERHSMGVAFSGCFFKDKEELLYTFERWNRLIYVNAGKTKVIKTIDTCDVYVTKTNAFGTTIIETRPCDFNILYAFIVDSYIVTCPIKVLSPKNSEIIFDIYDKALGTYMFSMPFGIQVPPGAKILPRTVRIGNTPDQIIYIYTDHTANVLVEYTLSKNELLHHIENFKKVYNE